MVTLARLMGWGSASYLNFSTQKTLSMIPVGFWLKQPLLRFDWPHGDFRCFGWVSSAMGSRDHYQGQIQEGSWLGSVARKQPGRTRRGGVWGSRWHDYPQTSGLYKGCLHERLCIECHAWLLRRGLHWSSHTSDGGALRCSIALNNNGIIVIYGDMYPTKGGPKP